MPSQAGFKRMLKSLGPKTGRRYPYADMDEKVYNQRKLKNTTKGESAFHDKPKKTKTSYNILKPRKNKPTINAKGTHHSMQALGDKFVSVPTQSHKAQGNPTMLTVVNPKHLPKFNPKGEYPIEGATRRRQDRIDRVENRLMERRDLPTEGFKGKRKETMKRISKMASKRISRVRKYEDKLWRGSDKVWDKQLGYRDSLYNRKGGKSKGTTSKGKKGYYGKVGGTRR